MAVVRSLEELEVFARDAVASLSPKKQATVMALYGDLGAGKTAFVKAAAKTLGILETVTSPTFVLEKIYLLEGRPFSQLIHIDAYRLLRPEELTALGFETMAADPKNLIFIEWAERVETLLPKDAMRLRFKTIDETTREVTFNYGETSKK